jgi:hypothetical protein
MTTENRSSKFDHQYRSQSSTNLCHQVTFCKCLSPSFPNQLLSKVVIDLINSTRLTRTGTSRVRMMGNVGRFVKNRNDTPINSFGNKNQASNHTLTDRHRRAEDARVKAPATRLEVNPEHNVSSLTDLALALAARHPLHSDSEPGSVSTISWRRNVTDLEQRKSKFDDTELEDSTISSLDGIQHESLYVTSTDYKRVLPQSSRAVDTQYYGEQQYGGIDDDDASHADPKVEGDVAHHGHDLFAHGLDQIRIDPDELVVARNDAEENVRHFYAQTQTPPLPHSLHNPAAVRRASPEPLGNRPPSRPRSAQKANMPPPSKPKKSTVVIPQPIATTHATAFDKTSSYTDSSANTTPPPPENSRENRKKRPISDLLDYDPATLKTMSFSDLSNQPFDLDPRRPADPSSNPTPSSESHHQQKLLTLKSLSDNERAKFFSSQTQDQWASSTAFFDNRLKELSEELRKARQRRRDVAGRFEEEVAARMGWVKGSGEGIDSCLGDIRGKARGVLPGRAGTPMG